MIFFSAHGVPLAYVEEAGDPYKAEMEECVDLIMEELEKRNIVNAYTLAYQVFVFLRLMHMYILLADKMLNFLAYGLQYYIEQVALTFLGQLITNFIF